MCLFVVEAIVGYVMGSLLWVLRYGFCVVARLELKVIDGRAPPGVEHAA